LLFAVPFFAIAAPLRDGNGKCVWFPPSNPLRRDISALPVHENSKCACVWAHAASAG
jgi:hypothetical protein